MACLVRQMGYVVVETPFPEASAADLTMIVGVRRTKTCPDCILLSCNERLCEVAFFKSDRVGIRAIGLETWDAAAVAEVKRRVASDGCTVVDDKPSVDGVEHAVRFRTPFGPIFEVHTPIWRDTRIPKNDPLVRATRLDHANIRVADPRSFHDFITKTLKLQLSDRTEDFARAWYRAGDGFHHTLAAAPGNGLHHYGFNVSSVFNLTTIADSLVTQGRSLLWGLGRHGPGNNVFSYYLDPNNCVIEASFGMERLDDGSSGEAGVWSDAQLSQMLDLWGSAPPPNYAHALTPFFG
jgi:catechol 2,3-dioxygenase